MSIKHILKEKVASLYSNAVDAHEASIVTAALEKENFLPEKNNPPSSTENIAIIVGSIVKFSGGHTSMLRLGTGLSQYGKKITYISFQNQNKKEMEENAKSNLSTVRGAFLKLADANLKEYDIVIATSWQSVYYARRFDAYKMYFVQDYEPYFFKLGERYILAKKTYELGLHIVSLGRWNIEQIHKNIDGKIDSKLDYIDFPYEPAEYIHTERDYSSYINKKQINIAVYSKEDGKRIPNLLQVNLKKAAEDLADKGININIYFFGFDKNTKLLIGENLGKLRKEEMVSLYRKVDFGMVASMTNISLVPYEMLATGLPIIEFSEGSFPCFFPRGAASLVDFNYQSICNVLLKCTTEKSLIESQVKVANEYLKTLSWNHSCSQFEKIIENL